MFYAHRQKRWIKLLSKQRSDGGIKGEDN